MYRISYTGLYYSNDTNLQKKEDLVLKVQSQADHAWIEQVLMKELGVVPENQIKVHFKN